MVKVSAIMSSGVQTVSRGTPAANAGARMRTKAIHHLVVKDGSELVGVVSARDLAHVSRRGAAAKRLTVADVMSPHVVTIEATAPIRRAARVMRGRSIGCLVVVDDRDDKKVVGILTVSDLLDWVDTDWGHRPAHEEGPALHFRVPHRKQHGSGGAW